MQDNIIELIKSDHEGDEKQIEVILTDRKRVVVEAPAGCGKTKTMVSKVLYIISSKRLNQNKKLLALTFSVNAAYKMKKDISEKLPQMGVKNIFTPADINRKIAITNYHGFARRILSLYGYLLDENLKNINDYRAVNEENDRLIEDYNLILTEEEQTILIEFSNAIKDSDVKRISTYYANYYDILITKFLPNNCITYNGYLLLCRKLLCLREELKIFYQKLYPFIIIDEFQDTNILSWEIVKLLVSDETELFFMGDSLQRIYGFIGAIPNLINTAVKKFDMTKIILAKNYRFRNNADMLLLDKNIRLNAENYLDPVIEANANVSLDLLNTQEEEANWVANKVSHLLVDYHEDKVAILVQQRGVNINMIMQALEDRAIDYFYALFSDEDDLYLDFHKIVLKEIFNELKDTKSNRITKRLLRRIFDKVKKHYSNNTDPIIYSLLMLTEVFFEKICVEYSFLTNEERLAYINDTFENRALKQNMEYITSKVIVSTVHGAKGLEWGRVIMPDMEPYIFPNFYGLCGNCNFRTGRDVSGDYCRIEISDHDQKSFIEELSVFYVGVTRARKEVFFSASKKRYNNQNEEKNSYISCLLTLPGIAIG